MKLLTITIVAAFALSLPGAAFAQTMKKTTTAATGKKSTEKPAGAGADAGGKTVKNTATKSMPMHARADSIDVSGNRFTMKTQDGREVEHALSETTEVRNGDAAAKLADIKAGDWVSGSRIKRSDTKYEVVKITKFGPKPDKAEAKEAWNAGKQEKMAKKEAAKPEEKTTNKN